VCQSQSVNLFLPANVHKRDLHEIHMMAWKRGLKSLYYCRSLSIQRADTVSDMLQTSLMMPANDSIGGDMAPLPLVAAPATNYEECLACQ
jgi:ribonucleoside-diphosphate reductase alpha chain